MIRNKIDNPLQDMRYHFWSIHHNKMVGNNTTEREQRDNPPPICPRLKYFFRHTVEGSTCCGWCNPQLRTSRLK